MSKIKLGSLVRDKITNFTGVVTGHADYLTGCDQYIVQPKCENTTAYPEGKWFDEGRLEVLSVDDVTAEQVAGDKNGCDYSAPIK